MADCPRCLVERLHPAKGEHGGSACRACRGAWLPTDAALRLLADPFGPLETLPRLPTGIHALRCPTCRAALERRHVAAIELDVCLQHGVWFDHREIDRVRTAAEQHRHGLVAPQPPTHGLAAAAVLISPTPTHSSQSNNGALEPIGEAADVTDVAVSALEIVDIGEVTGGAFELLSGALEALFSGL
jgi:Zn-finger nucleic acid-binding protein